jgi:serine/threonine protein kinase
MVIQHPVPRTPRIENLADVFLAASNLPVAHHRTPAWLPEAPTDTVPFDEETPAPPELPGEVLRSGCWGHLRLKAHAGQGGFGHVYRAWDSRLDREVALKLLPSTRRRPAGGVVSAIDEGRLLARVRHPNVVTIYGAEQIDDIVGLWMEFVHGKTLSALLSRHVPFDVAEATEICLDLSAALSAVHEAGILHGDIKASNVMRARDGRIVLIDFGASRAQGDRSMAAGTPPYLAPEVLQGDPVTVRSDIYSLGVLLFHLVTDEYPVAGRTEWANLHPSLRRVVERAADPDPARRYPGADAFAADLRVGNIDAIESDFKVLRGRPGISCPRLRGRLPHRPAGRGNLARPIRGSHVRRRQPAALERVD